MKAARQIRAFNLNLIKESRSTVNIFIRPCHCTGTFALVMRDSGLTCPSCGNQINPTRVSPSRISALCVPDFCAACYWTLLHLKFKKPFDFGTPYIMQELDKHQKQLARVALQEEGQLPDFFGPFKNATEIIPIDALSCYDAKTNLHLFGYPDLVFGYPDATAKILDDKTAHAKPEGDPLGHQYQGQLSLYKFMLEHGQNPRKVSGLGLLYYEFSGLTDEEMANAYTDESIEVRFKPRCVDIPIKGSDALVRELLSKVRKLLDMPEPPPGKKDCKDCELIGLYSPLLNKVAAEEPVAALCDSVTYREQLARKHYLDTSGLTSFQENIVKGLQHSANDPYSVLANWDFSNSK